MTVTDRIEKRVLLAAPLARVWNAIGDAKRFGTWFGVELDGDFEPGKPLTGRIVPTQMDEEIAKAQEPHRGAPFDITVEAVVPMRHLSFRWHPFAIDKEKDYSSEPTTLVSFDLEETAEGTLLTIRESGFDRIPLERRAKAFAANEGGWAAQAKLIERYVTGPAR